MTIEEWRKRYVGKLIRIDFRTEYNYGIVGICTEINEYHNDEVEMLFINVDGYKESYLLNIDNSRDGWWCESWEEFTHA